MIIAVVDGVKPRTAVFFHRHIEHGCDLPGVADCLERFTLSIYFIVITFFAIPVASFISARA